jgi:hypothetical protein
MGTCQICGRRPATELTIRRHVGMIVLQKFVRFRGTLCRDHGAAMSKEFLRKTLVEGWWGLISVFANFYAVYTDLAALSKANKLGPPMGAPVPPAPAASAWAEVPPPPPLH